MTDWVAIVQPFKKQAISLALKQFISLFDNRFALINQKINQLMFAPFKTGRGYLRDAQRASDASTRRQRIEDAYKSFQEGRGNVKGYNQVEAEIMIAYCHWLMEDPDTAQAWLRDAKDTARSTMLEFDEAIAYSPDFGRHSHLTSAVKSHSTSAG